MSDINTKIKNLIKCSILLNKEQKQEIKEKLKNSSPEEKQSLIIILESEKTSLKKIIFKYIEKNGKDGVEKLNRIIASTKSSVSQKKENIDKDHESLVMEELLNKLEESGN